MTSKLTRERLQEIAEDGFLKHGESKELARMVLAAMDSEPHTDDELSNLLWYSQEATCHSDPNYYCEFQRLATPGLIAGIIRELQELRKADSEPVAEVLSNRPGNDTSTIDRALPVGTQLYRHAQKAPERDQVRIAHAEWSQATFGNVGPVGPLKHLSKEALEAAAEPDDLSEWADMQFLLWDAQRRAGITDEQITQAMIEKLAVNKQREWPEPKDGEPRLHIKAQPAPVVPEEATPDSIEILASARRRDHAVFQWDEDQRNAAADSWNACRAAMLAAAPQSPGSEPATVPGKWIPVSEQMPPSRHEVLVGRWWGEKPLWCCKWATYIPGHPDAQSSGWLIPGASWTPTHWMPLPAAPQEVKSES
ncbi:dATP/dGTP pyrophosphohydrolase domain-containing protein [Enterococcus faecalis]|uniref:dATP/dGTP pyrophosphohydrolase domain-containing protein n=2 Tax=Bacteria TaxID=2 RepID=UPI001C8F7B7F|nr:dATP/dGTP pyrophosphohydrolase domain-containing protein [Enterococcus faecalis]